MLAYDVLGRLKYSGGLKDCRVIIRHRGAPKNEKEIRGERILEIKKTYFIYKGRKETIIPYHRIVRVLKGDVIVWERKILGD